MGLPFEEKKQEAIEKLRETVRQHRLEVYAEGSERIRKDAATAIAEREDEVPMSWDSQRASALQVPLPPFVEAPSSIPPGITHALDPDYQRRNVYWQAFAKKSAEAGKAHAATSTAVRTYVDAAHDDDLGALGYSIGANERIDVAAATEREIVPNQRPRRSVGTLFDSQNELAIDYQIDGFGAVENSVKEGKSGAKSADEETQRADERLRSQMKELESYALALKASTLRLQSAASTLAAFTAHQAGEQARADIDELKEQAEQAAELVETMFDIAAMFVHFSAEGGEGVGDGIEKLGDLAARVVSHMNDDKIERAKQKLEELRIDETRNAGLAQLQHVGSAALDVRANFTKMDVQRKAIRSAAGARKTAYGNLGESAARAVPSAPGKDKVAATLAAIPLVEVVVAKAHEMREAARVPKEDPAGMRGLRIAYEHRHPSARSFLGTCDQLNAAHERGLAEERKWAARRDQLFQVKESMFGRRPGSTE